MSNGRVVWHKAPVMGVRWLFASLEWPEDEAPEAFDVDGHTYVREDRIEEDEWDVVKSTLVTD